MATSTIIRKWVDLKLSMRSIATAFVAILLAIRPAIAVDPNIRITQYGHAAWRMQDGVFDSVPNAITQTADGYIWIGTGSGLLKFDGAHFASWTPPAGRTFFAADIRSLHGSSDGTLWIGTAARLLSLKNNELHDHVRGRINSLLEDHKGRVWVARSRAPDSSGGLCQVVGDHPGCVGGDDRMQLPYAEGLAEDVHGSLWVGSGNQVLQWKDGSFEPYLRKELQPFNGQAGVESIAAGVDGGVWAAIPIQGIGLYQLADGLARRAVFAGIDTERIQTVFTDRDRSLWLGTTNDGIYRVSGSRVDHFRSEDGLSSNTVTSFFQDREGNVWVATSKGLDCFRDRRVITFSTSEGLAADLAMSVVATADGKVWVGNKDGLNVLDGDRVRSIKIPGQRVTSLFEDHAKRLWVGVDDGLTVYGHGAFEKVKRPDGRPLGMVVAMAEDPEQNLWASVTGTDRKLFQIRDGRVQREFGLDQIPVPRLLMVDPAGGIWLGFSNGNIGRYRDGNLETVPLPQSKTPIAGLTVDGDGSVWAATRGGMVHWKDRESKILTSKNGLPCDGFFSSIRDNQATLWMNSTCGLIGIPDSELARWWHQPATRVQFRLLDVFDGAMPGLTTFQPALAKSRDGRLWFVNDAVLQMIDPGRLRFNGAPPPIYVERMRVDGKEYPMTGPIRLPPRSRNIEIGYSAPSFSIPQKVRFRYRLDGRDTDWQDAGVRREALYNDFPPGQYHFRVSASNGDGAWNVDGATLNFSIDPAYYQTNWFRTLTWIAGFAALAGLYWLRLYFMRLEFNAHLEGRVDERLRVARELHDTLLQTFQASLVQMQAARNLLTRRPEQAVQNLDSAIKMTAEAIAEGRGAIQQLRSQSVAQSDLAELLTVTGQELARTHETATRVNWRVAVEGEKQDLQPILQDEIYRITRELLRNAFQHAQPRQIETEIRYEPRMLRVHVRDDGKGIDPEILKEGGRAGHWGFTGMSERAKQIGARLDFWSEAGVGTEVQLTVPASIAYRTPPKRWRLPQLLKNGGNS